MHAIHPDVDADVTVGGAVVVGVEADGEAVGGAGAGLAPRADAEVADGKARAVRRRDRAGTEREIEARGEAGERRGGGDAVKNDRTESARDVVGQLDATVG